MLTLQAVAAKIAKRNLPTLFPDTCALLDIVQGPERLHSNSLKAVLEISKAATKRPTKCLVVCASVVNGEFDEHFDSCAKKAAAHLVRLNHDLDFLDIVAKAARRARVIKRPHEDVPDFMQKTARDLLNVATVVKLDPHVTTRAVRRVIDVVPPAAKGKDSTKDCLILEEVTDVVGRVRSLGCAAPMIFITSNTADFCRAGGDFHPEIRSYTEPYKIALCKRWDHAAHEIGLI